MIRAAAKGKEYSLEQALAGRAKTAKYVRFGAIGDPSGLGTKAYKAAEAAVRKLGLGVLSYTHFWASRGKGLKGHAMASCDTWDQVDTALKSGWRATIHVKTLEGEPVSFDNAHFTKGKTRTSRSWVKCPAQQTNNRVQCNQCGLCDATKRGPIIVFVEH